MAIVRKVLILEIEAIVRLGGGVGKRLEVVDEGRERRPLIDLPVGASTCLDGATNSRPKVGKVGLNGGGVERPHGKVREQSTVHDHVLAAGLRILTHDRLEEDRNRHAHPYGISDLERVGIDAEPLRVPRKHEHRSVTEIGRVTCSL